LLAPCCIYHPGLAVFGLHLTSLVSYSFWTSSKSHPCGLNDHESWTRRSSFAAEQFDS